MTTVDYYLHSFFGNTIRKSFYKDFVDNLNLNGNEKIFEFGSGPGCLSKPIIRQLSSEGNLSCLDISDVAINILKKKLKKYNNVEYYLGDINKFKIKSNSYDLVIIHFVLHDVPIGERKNIIYKLSNLLKKGGKIVIKEPTKENHGMKGFEIKELMNQASLIEEKVIEQDPNNSKNGVFCSTFVK